MKRFLIVTLCFLPIVLLYLFAVDLTNWVFHQTWAPALLAGSIPIAFLIIIWWIATRLWKGAIFLLRAYRMRHRANRG
jgi:hypothetical protein